METVLWLLCLAVTFIIAHAECDAQCAYISHNDTFMCTNKKCTTVPTIQHPDKVSVIHLQKNSISEITEKFETPKLIHLDLSNNSINFIKTLSFTQCHSLQSLDLSFNNLTDIETSTFSGLYQLRWLYLSHNNIQYLGLDLFARTTFFNLVSLDLSFNKIKKMELTAFTDLSNLTTLRLNNNNLENKSLASHHFVGLKSLVHLYLDHNFLTDVTSGLFKHLESLRRLDLSQNSIKTVAQDAFDGLLNVMNIRLDWNLIKELKPNTFALESLETLNLNHNYMEKILPEYLTNCNATTLHLQYMDVLTSVEDGAFTFLPRLHTLYLSDNRKLNKINPGCFSSNNTLVFVDLSNNSLKGLREGILDWEVVQVDLSHNPWKCDSDLEWMVTYKMKWKHRQDTVCASPDHLKGRSIYELTPDDFNRKDPRHSPTNIVIGLLICLAFFVAATVITVLWKYRDRIMSQARTARYKFLYSGGEDMEDDHVTFNVTEERRLVTSERLPNTSEIV